MFINNETKRTTQDINTVHTIYRMTMPTPPPPPHNFFAIPLIYSGSTKQLNNLPVHVLEMYIRSYINSNRLRILGTTSCTRVYRCRKEMFIGKNYYTSILISH